VGKKGCIPSLSKNYLPVAQIRVICKNVPQVSDIFPRENGNLSPPTDQSTEVCTFRGILLFPRFLGGSDQDLAKKQTPSQVQSTYSGRYYQGGSFRPKSRGNALRNIVPVGGQSRGIGAS
jgi:hypothetical protein